MVGVGETYIGAYAINCGFSDRFAGLITALPLGIASILQLFSSRVQKWMGRRKRFVMLAAVGQALTLFLITGHNLFDRASPTLLLAVLTSYWVFGLSAGTAWNGWIVSLIAKKDRPGFFAKRGPWNEVSVLVALVGAGLSLKFVADKMLVFAFLFVVAGLARLASVFCFSKLPESVPAREPEDRDELDLPGLRQWLGQAKVRKMLLLIGVFNFGVYIAAPFFTPFMLRQLKLDYGVYMFLISLPFISRAVAYRFFEVYAPRWGLLPVLGPTMLAIALVPVLWALWPELHYLVFFQILSGVAWTGFEYSILLKQLSDFRPRERARVLTWTNFLVGLCNVAGVLIGSQILGRHPNQDSYFQLFYVSAAVRAMAIFVVFAVDWRLSQHYFNKIYWRIVGIRTNRGGENRPILHVDE
jgi:predicted MFS family arabinose efflux permease